MFKAINDGFIAMKRDLHAHRFITEAVTEDDEIVEELTGGDDGDYEDMIDTDSIPDELYDKIDAELDKIVTNPDYDDDEVEEMADDNDMDGSDDETVEVMDNLIGEAVSYIDGW